MSETRNGSIEDELTVVIRCDADRDELKKLIDQSRNGTTIRITPPRASDEMTSRMHCAIRCLSRQLEWAGGRMNEEDWKRLVVATLYGQRVVPSLDNSGFVVLDRRTRRMSGPMKHDIVEFVYSFGAERGVLFDDNE